MATYQAGDERRKRGWSFETGEQDSVKKSRSVSQCLPDNGRHGELFLDCPDQGELAAMLRNENLTLQDVIRSMLLLQTSLSQSFNSKLHRLESNLARKFDDRLNGVDEHLIQVGSNIEQLKGDLANTDSELADVKRKVTTLEGTVQDRPSPPSQLGLNIVLHNLPETNNENIDNKVNNVLKEGIKLQNITVESAKRKKSYKRNAPGIVVAKLKNAEDKKQVMLNKKKLADSRVYNEVSISHDKPLQQRVQEANLRTLAAAVGENKLIVKGSRILQRRNYKSARTTSPSRHSEQETGNQAPSTSQRPNQPQTRKSGHRTRAASPPSAAASNSKNTYY